MKQQEKTDAAKAEEEITNVINKLENNDAKGAVLIGALMNVWEKADDKDKDIIYFMITEFINVLNYKFKNQFMEEAVSNIKVPNNN